MAIEFRKEVVHSRFLDPSQQFAEVDYNFEVRADPLTGKSSYIYQLGNIAMPQKKDLSSLIQRSLDRGCPFCPQAFEQNTPKFVAELIPQGRLWQDEACIFPNIRPYAPYGAICVPSRQHFG